MKTISIFILLILLCPCGRTNKVKTITLINNENAIPESPNVDLHKDKDVEIFINKGSNQSMIYTCYMYRIHKGELKGYGVHCILDIKYDNASYQWVNDSTMTFSLSNKHHRSQPFTVTGYHRSVDGEEHRMTGLSVD